MLRQRAFTIIIIFIIVVVIMNYLKNEKKSVSPVGKEVSRRVKKILQAQNLDEFSYEILENDTSSHTTNKYKVNLCSSCIYDTKEKDYPIDKLTYVALHEISHVINKGRDHDDEWRKIFQKLLWQAGEFEYIKKSWIVYDKDFNVFEDIL